MFNSELKHPSSASPRILAGINAAVSLYRDTLVVQRKGIICGLKPLAGNNEQVINLRHILRVDADHQILRFELQDRDAVFIVYSRHNETQAREIVRFVRQNIAERRQAVS